MYPNDGQTVKVHYTGSLADGNVFDSSRDTDPLEFEVGSGKVIQGFDDAVKSMKIGETKTVTIPADQAYGQVREELIQILNREAFPKDMTLEIGLELYGQSENGQTMIFVIDDIQGDDITINANHFLAGQDLTFELELMEITD